MQVRAPRLQYLRVFRLGRTGVGLMLKHVRYEMGMLISINMQECVRTIISDK
jgi:hypothetical protein